MATILKSKTTDNTLTGSTISSWSRQQKIAMIAGFVILGLLLGLGACSKQSAKPALAGVSSPTTTPAAPAVAPVPTTTAQAAPAAPKKVQKKRPANVTFRDPGSGLSFLYPRKYELTVGDKAWPQFTDMRPAPMNFAQPGGVTVATVTVPAKSYPGTDFSTAFFTANLNRGLTAEQCSQFAFVDKRVADGQPDNPEKVKVGSKDMQVVSDFSASALKQAEAKYYHSYENGACYEYVLGLGTAGFGTENIEPVDRDAIFQKLEKIMATVTVQPVDREQQVAEKTANPSEPAK
jgi:hypothetical protein